MEALGVPLKRELRLRGRGASLRSACLLVNTHTQ